MVLLLQYFFFCYLFISNVYCFCYIVDEVTFMSWPANPCTIHNGFFCGEIYFKLQTICLKMLLEFSTFVGCGFSTEILQWDQKTWYILICYTFRKYLLINNIYQDELQALRIGSEMNEVSAFKGFAIYTYIFLRVSLPLQYLLPLMQTHKFYLWS